MLSAIHKSCSSVYTSKNEERMRNIVWWMPSSSNYVQMASMSPYLGRSELLRLSKVILPALWSIGEGVGHPRRLRDQGLKPSQNKSKLLELGLLVVDCRAPLCEGLRNCDMTFWCDSTLNISLKQGCVFYLVLCVYYGFKE